MTVEELIAHLRKGEISRIGGESTLDAIKRPVSPIKCLGGFTVSVQASTTAYSTPRNNEGPWTHVELGFPSKVIPELLEYAEDPEDPTGTVYPYTPIELIVKVINDEEDKYRVNMQRKGLI